MLRPSSVPTVTGGVFMKQTSSLAASGHKCITPSSLGGGGWHGTGQGARQRQGKGGALARHTLDGDIASVCGDNFLHQVQPQPGPPRLRGIERLKNLPEVLHG